MSVIYIHWPYCLSKCYYCDFNSIICNNKIDLNKYLILYKNVLSKLKEQYYNNEEITSIYFGGGTPSLLSTEFMCGILDYIYLNFNITNNIEITLEANPKTIDKVKATEFKQAGINRLSIGVQSLRDDDLKILGRIHNSYDALMCIYDMVFIFDNISIDIIYNRPGQNIKEWINELFEIFKLPINHLSMYELIIEDNTYIKHIIDSGILPSTNESSKFFDITYKLANENGFEMYEVSNYVKKGTNLYSKHNLSYWNYNDYYGVGAGAHSRVSNNNSKIAIEQISNVKKWCQWAENPHFNIEVLSKLDEYKERIIMGLRTKFGLNVNSLDLKTRNNLQFNKKVNQLINNKYAFYENNYLKLTYEGIIRLNMIESFLINC